MANDRYTMVCDVPTGTAPSDAACVLSYVPQVDLILFPPLTIAEGGQIAAAILVCWAVGWGIKQAITAVRM